MTPRTIRFGTGRPGSKFGNHKTQRGGLVFDSKKEADRYDQLLLLERAGRIRNLQRQVKYDLRVNGVLIATYKADATYEEFDKGEWISVVEDSKGYPNDRWPMKKKLMRAVHGISIRET